jgi:pimeloyl-ACP methyl ester carboxylesterase
MPTYGRRVGRLLDVLGVEKPVFVTGHSFGGGVAIALASARPERVRSLTLINSVGGAPGQRAGLVDASWLRWMLGTLTELSPRDIARSTPSMVRAFVPNLLHKPITMALTAKLALTADLSAEAARLVAAGLPVLFIWGDQDRLILPGALKQVEGSLPAEMVHGKHGWLLSEPEEFSALLRNALVVHAMLERSKRGQSVVLPKGATLADLLPQERRTAARVAERRAPARGAS